MNNIDIALLGNVALDITAYIGDDSFTCSSESSIAKDITAAAGSCAVNHCKAMLSWGAAPHMVSMCAGDMLGSLLLDDLKSHGIDTKHIFPLLQENNKTVLLVKEGGNKFMYSKRAGLPEQNVLENLLLPILKAYAHIHVVLNDWNKPLVQKLHAAAPDITLSTDLHLNVREPDPAILSCMKIVFFSGDGLSNPLDVINKILSMGPQIVVCTLGAEGGLLGTKDGTVAKFSAVCQTEPIVDTVGAGDVFASTFLCSYYSDGSIAAAIQRASVQAGYSCTRYGLDDLLPRSALLSECY